MLSPDLQRREHIKTRSTLLFRQRASLFMLLLQTVCEGRFRGADYSPPPVVLVNIYLLVLIQRIG